MKGVKGFYGNMLKVALMSDTQSRQKSSMSPAML